MKANIIWIDPNIDNQRNSKYTKELEEIDTIKFKSFKTVEDAIKFIKDIQFEETKVIINEKLYSEYISDFKKEIINICVVPKIIVFTNNY